MLELQFDNLRVTFNSKSSDIKRQEPQIHEYETRSSFSEVLEMKRAEKQALGAEELNLREDELAMKLITDPAEYERLLVSGELDA